MNREKRRRGIESRERSRQIEDEEMKALESAERAGVRMGGRSVE